MNPLLKSKCKSQVKIETESGDCKMACSEGINRVVDPFLLHLKMMELELNCPSCLKLLNQPMLLPCDHILCSHCMRTSNDKLSCCVCRLPFVIKDLRRATHLERLLNICKNMCFDLSALQQSSLFGISESEAPFTRTPVSCNNHAVKKCTRVAGDETFVDEGELSPPIDIHDSDSDSWDQEGQTRTDRQSASMSLKEGLNRGTKHVKMSMTVESKRCRLENDLSGSHAKGVVMDESTIETCAFCHSFRNTEASGEMLHYLNGEPISEDQGSQPNVLHVHRKCIVWAPQVYFLGETIMNLEAELSRSSKIKCCSCGLKGAALGCYVKNCRRSYHVPCAYEIKECRWDCENFLLLCPCHVSHKLPCDKPKSRKFKEPSISANHENFSGTQQQHGIWMSSSSLNKDWVICGSDLSKEEKILLDKFARLSCILVTYKWEQNVTHVIAATNEDGACIRTMKYLMAILSGRWVLNIGWIRACLEAGHPVPEENYEITHDVHGCFDGPKNGRIRATQRAPKLFKGFAFYFSGFFEPSYNSNLKDLVIAGGGKVVSKLELLQLKICSRAAGEIEKVFVVYNIEPPMNCNSMDADNVVQERDEDAEGFAAKVGAVVVRHTLFLNAIAAYDLDMFSS